MNATYAEWNPKLMEVFSPKELIILENVMMYLKFENNIAYQDSMYETIRDSGEEPEDLDSIPGENRETQDYEIFDSISRKLTIFHNAKFEELPENIYTEPKYSCNCSNKIREEIVG